MLLVYIIAFSLHCLACTCRLSRLLLFDKIWEEMELTCCPESASKAFSVPAAEAQYTQPCQVWIPLIALLDAEIISGGWRRRCLSPEPQHPFSNPLFGRASDACRGFAASPMLSPLLVSEVANPARVSSPSAVARAAASASWGGCLTAWLAPATTLHSTWLNKQLCRMHAYYPAQAGWEVPMPMGLANQFCCLPKSKECIVVHAPFCVLSLRGVSLNEGVEAMYTFLCYLESPESCRRKIKGRSCLHSASSALQQDKAHLQARWENLLSSGLNLTLVLHSSLLRLGCAFGRGLSGEIAKLQLEQLRFCHAAQSPLRLCPLSY